MKSWMKSYRALAALATAFLGAAFLGATLSQAGNAIESTNDPVLSSYVVPDASPELLNEISKRFEITNRRGTTVDVIVPAREAPLLKRMAPKAVLLEADLAASANSKIAQFNLLSSTPYRYRSLSEVHALLRKIEADYPAIAEVTQYGTTPQGYPLLALKISDNVKVDETETEVMITAATHGDELITTEVVLELIDQLLKGYGTDQRLSNFITQRELFFIPVVNADGFLRRTRYDNGRDPNRSYPYPTSPSVQPTPSIAALIAFFHTRQIAASIDFHAYGEMVMYPWAYSSEPIPADHHQHFDPLAKQMAATNGYVYGSVASTIYIARGSSADYYYWKNGTTAIAIEVGSEKIPSPREFPDYFKSQLESTWILIENAKSLGPRAL